MTEPLQVAALDFVIDRAGQPWFIEANDRPMGLLVCDEFTAEMGDMALPGQPLISCNMVAIADLLASMGSTVVIASVEPLAEPARDVPDWLAWELKEMDVLRQLLARRAVNCWTDREGSIDRDAVVYRRSFDLEPGQYCRVVNDQSAYVVTGSKYMTHTIVERCRDVRQPVSLWAGYTKDSIMAGVNEIFEMGIDACVIKPDWGSLGLAVDVCYSRCQAEEIMSQRVERRGIDWFDQFGPFLVQGLINGDVYVDGQGRGYLYDVRVYVVGRTVTGAVARRSAVPEQFRHESSVAHVGAGGGLVPIIIPDRPDDITGSWDQSKLPLPVTMPGDTWSEICEAAAAVCRELSAAGRIDVSLPLGLNRPPGFDWYLKLFQSVSERG